jgi:hypothetical protein
MSQTTTLAHPVMAVIRHPAQILMHLIATLLTPMFLGITGGDVGLARAAAIETVNSYRAQNLSDLIAIAQMVGYGLAALGSLSLSFGEDLSLSMTLRLLNNANACTRSAEKNRRGLSKDYGEPLCFSDVPQEAEAPCIVTETACADETDAPADVRMDDSADNEADQAMDRMLAAQSMASLRASRQVRTEVAPAPDVASEVTEKRYREMLAIVLVKESGEITDSISGLPPEEREAAILRAGTLSGMAHQLLMGGDLPAEFASGIEATPDFLKQDDG